MLKIVNNFKKHTSKMILKKKRVNLPKNNSFANPRTYYNCNDAGTFRHD